MTVYELMAKLGAAGIKLWVEEGQLKFKAPKGALTPDLKQNLVENKQAVIDFLNESSLDANSEANQIPQVDRTQPVPLSQAQQRLWFVEQLTPGSSTFHIPAALYLNGILDHQALENAFIELIKRHETLRTVFISEGGQPWQVIQPTTDFKINQDSVTHIPESEREEAVKRLVEKEIRTSFDLEKGPLIRAHLYKLDDNKHGLIVTMHHIITDGWSMGVFVREISALYASQRMGMKAPLPELSIQYGDFSAWQKDWLQGDELERQLSYWRTRLGNAPDQLMLPFDRPRPPLQTLNGATLDVNLTAEVASGLRKLARQFDTTLYVILMAAYNVVLSKWAKQADVCVGMPVAGRTRPEVENLIGFFVNTLVIRSQLGGNPTLAELIRQIKENVLGAQSHQDLPFEAIVDDLNVPRNLSFAPVYQVAFSLTSDEGTAKKATLGGLEIEPMPIELVSARLDLTLMLVDGGDSISGMLEYNTDLFDGETVSQFLKQFEHVLRLMSDDVEQKIDTVSLQTQSELKSLLGLDDNVEAVLSLAPMQRDFCLDSLLEPDTLRNSIGYAVKLPFEVDRDRWQAALDQVNQAQPFLRSTVVSCDVPGLEPLYQVVHKTLPAQLEELTWQGEALNEENVVAQLEKVALKTWDIEGKPLWCHYLVSCEDGAVWAVSAAHHSVSDGVSKYGHFTQTLGAYLGDEPPVCEVGYLQSWIKQRTDITDTKQTLDFWGAQLADVEPVAIKAKNAGAAHVQLWDISADELNGLSDWCKSNSIGVAGYLRTLYTLALQQCYYQAEPLVVIDAVSGRESSDSNWSGCAFGFVPFVQTASATAQNSFKALLQANRQWKKSVGDNQYLSMYARRKFVDANALEFQFNYRMPLVGQTLKQGGYEFVINLIQPDNAGTVKLLVTTRADSVQLRLSYRENEFNGFSLIQRMKSVHQQIMNGADQLDQLQWLLPDENQKLLTVGAGATQAAPSFIADIEKQFSQHAESDAVVCGTERLTYGELEKASNKLVNWLVNEGVSTQDKVAVCLGRSAFLPVAYLSVARSPGAYVPLDSAYPAERIQYILADCQAKVLITERCVLERFDSEQIQLPAGIKVVLREDLNQLLETMSDHSPSHAPAPDDALYYVYTSGSTGKPKGAGVTYAGEDNLQSWYRAQLGCTSDDKVLLASAVGFDLTQKNLFVGLINGATLVVPEQDEYDPELYANIIAQEGISIINCAPSAFYPIIDETLSGYPFASLKQVVLGGEPIRISAVQAWLNHPSVNAAITNSYGPTECTDVVASSSVTQIDSADFVFPIGKAIHNANLYITNNRGHLMPYGASGELRIGGACVGTGYWNREELNQQAFSQNPHAFGNWYRTGDICRFDNNGDLIYVGRTDFQLKLRGLRIEPGEIDNQLKLIDSISDALTLVNQERLVSYCLLDAKAQKPDVDSVKSHLRQHLPDFMVPASVVFLTQWPLTPNGKIDRKALPEPELGEAADFVAPRNESEEKIAEIWQQVLKVSEVSVKSNFFEIGGHSLLATQVISRLRKAFGVELSVRVLFESPTIEKLVQAISTASSAGLMDSADPLVPLDPPNRDTLSFAQYRLWFVDQLNQGSSEYNLPAAMRIKGELNVPVLERVFAEIIQRHEVLRTNFGEHEGVPQLIVHEASDWVLPVSDLSSFAEDEQLIQIERRVDEDAARVYSLKDDALFTAELLKLNSQEHILLMNMHHIISDGWSLGVLVQEIQALYGAFVANQGSPLPPLPIQYSDFAVWQRNWIQGDVLESMRSYWQQALHGAPDVLRLPTDKPRPKHQTFNGAHASVGLGAELSSQVNDFCEQHDLTPFMVLMGCYQILLSRYSNQKDVCVGTPIAGRNRAEIEGLIGFFINGLVIRTQMQDNPSVLEYMAQVKTAALGAYAHQDMPADLLLDAIKMERTADTSPGAQVGFALQNVAQESVNAHMAGLTIEPVAREHKTAKYELSLILQESNGEFAGVAEYNTDLFVESTINQMMDQFKRVVQQVVSMPALSLEQIQLSNENEIHALLNVNSDEYELAALSPMQRDMYIDSLANPDTLKNSLGYHFITAAEFDVSVWRQAIQQVVAQQPLLRATIVASNIPYIDVAYLKIAKHHTPNIQFEDLSSQNLSDQAAAELARNRVWQSYDVEGQLSEYFVFKLGEHRHMVVFRMNHIVLDGAGMSVHLQECIKAAEAIKNNEQYVAAENIYPQYVEESRKRFDSFDVIKHWKQAAQNLEALDFSLPEGKVGESARVERTLPIAGEHWQSIQAYCKQAKITPSLYFKAIYGLLINAYCRGESDFYISEIMAGRNGAHRRALGNYFQALPVVYPQSIFSPESDIGELFSYIRHYRKSLRANANISLLMQRQLLPQGRLHFMFNYYNFIPTVNLFDQPVSLTAYPQVQDGPVQFVVQEQDGACELSLIYLSDLFSDLQFLQRVEHISQQIISGVNSIQALSLVLPNELNAMQAAPADQAEKPWPTVVHGFIDQAHKTPLQVAVKHGAQSLTYGELNKQSSQLAGWLIDNGVKPGDRVAVCLDRGTEFIVAIWAAMKAGATYLPMDSNYPAERLSFIVEDSKAPVLLTQQCVLARLTESGVNLENALVLELDSSSQWRGDIPAELPLPSPNDAIYAIYTSGSTGKPKGALVTHAGEVNLQQWYLSALNATDQDRFLLMSATGFDLTQKNLIAPLLVGATLIIPEMEQFDVDVIATTIAQDQVTIINCAPSAFYPVAENQSHSGYPFSSVRQLVLGGEPIVLDNLRHWLDASGCQLMNSYGPTECTDVVAYHQVNLNDHSDGASIPIGRAINETELYVVDACHHILPAGVVGELCIAGTGVGLGYIDRPDLNQAAFQANPFTDANWYRTGDLVRYRADGNIEYIGRKDFQVKLRGLRIELGEVESALRDLAQVNDSLTLVKDDRLISYVITQDEIDQAQLKQGLRNRLPDYMVPASIVSLSVWPLTPNGKIDRNALPDADQSERVEYVAPTTETEQTLAAIWSEVLGVDKIGVHDSFFDLGGHSLLAARAVSKFRQAFEIDIQLRSLFELHTIAEIAQYVDTMKWAAKSAEQAAEQADQSSEGREEGLL